MEAAGEQVLDAHRRHEMDGHRDRVEGAEDARETAGEPVLDDRQRAQGRIHGSPRGWSGRLGGAGAENGGQLSRCHVARHVDETATGRPLGQRVAARPKLVDDPAGRPVMIRLTVKKATRCQPSLFRRQHSHAASSPRIPRFDRQGDRCGGLRGDEPRTRTLRRGHQDRSRDDAVLGREPKKFDAMSPLACRRVDSAAVATATDGCGR